MDLFENLSTDYEGIFRDYGSTNLGEFFSVSLEVFFEKPAYFAEHLPNLFKHTCLLLNQYPLSKEWLTSNKLENEVKAEPLLVISNYSNSNFSWTVRASVMSIMIIIAIYSFIKEAYYLTFFALLFFTQILIKPYYDRLKIKNDNYQLYVYDNGLGFMHTKSKKEELFSYDDLILIIIEEYEFLFNFTVSIPNEGDIKEFKYVFYTKEDKIDEVREILHSKPTPVIFKN